MNKDGLFYKLSRDVIAVLATTTALITIVITLRSGYEYFQQYRYKSSSLENWKVVAEKFIGLSNVYTYEVDAMDLALYALDQAIILSPDDPVLKRQLFLVRAKQADLHLNSIAFAIDDWRDELPELSVAGRVALKEAENPQDRAVILLYLAKIEYWMPRLSKTTETLLLQASELDPENAEIWFEMANQRLAQDSLDKTAITLLEQAVMLSPGDALYLYRLAMQYEKHDEYPPELSRDLFKRASEADVSRSDILRRNARSFAENKL
jgi:tetratricopeptide (TPR) repeat protein